MGFSTRELCGGGNGLGTYVWRTTLGLEKEIQDRQKMGQAQMVWENYREKNDDLKLYSISQCFNFSGEAQICNENSWDSKRHMGVILFCW